MSKATAFSLGADRRLKRQQQIETLFQSGRAFSVFPLRVIWRLTDSHTTEEPVRAGFSAPKRKFRKAVDRGRTKRLLREAWRHRQQALWPAIPQGKQLHLFLMYTHHELPDYVLIEATLDRAIEKLKPLLRDA